MAKDAHVERSVQEGDHNDASTPATTKSTNEDANAKNATNKDSGYFGKYNWDIDKTKKGEKASLVPASGAIGDYAWGDGTKFVSVYITLPGLDGVPDDELKATLINDNKGLSFKIRSLDGKCRFLKVDTLTDKVKSVKIVRKTGRDQVVLKLRKEEERKWWDLKKRSGSSHGSFGNDDEFDDGWSDSEEDFMELPNEDKKAKTEEADLEEKKEGDAVMEDTAEPSE